MEMKTPNRTEILKKMAEAGLTEAEIEHSKTVADIALIIADEVTKVDGKRLDKELIEAAALLHDIGLVHCRGRLLPIRLHNTRIDLPRDLHLHPAKGSELVEELGFSKDIALAVLRHEGLSLSNDEYKKFGITPFSKEDALPKTMEETVILLADLLNWVLKTGHDWRDTGSVVNAILPTLNFEFKVMTGKEAPKGNPVIGRVRKYQAMMTKYLSPESLSSIHPK
jgi:putative nucleotidyltransferase with HDIG domain